MTFDDILDQAIERLQRRGRVTYRALKLQFNLDDEYLDVLKDEILYVHESSVQADQRGFTWTGEIGSPEPDAQREVDAEGRFLALLRGVIWTLQRDRRITYRELTHIFGLDDALLERIREELIFKQLAHDEQDKGLVWSGETQTVTPPVVDVSSQTTAAPTLSPVTETSRLSNGPTAPEEAIATGVLQGEPAVTFEPTRSTPEAEHRQLTVMFCDLADSTKLSQQLDPEDLREVIRAYQQTSAEVIQRFDGYIAQHLGDGLLIYFGWPRAHEDDAQRALHSGLGIVEAITTNLNPRLKQDKGVQLTVRLGVHTGPVVVGQMGGGERLENLATGETVNIAARLEGLAQPNTVVISNVTERLVRGAFTMENLGPQILKGVTEPMAVFRVLGPTEVRRDEDESLPDGGVFLVGRDEEIGLLLRRWEQSKEGLGQVVLINGEAGIGKSSLTATMRRHVMDEGHTRITFRCSPYHTNSALYPIITHLEQMLGFERDDPSGTKLDKLEQALRMTHLPLEESVPLLAALLSVPLEDRYSSPTQSPQQQRQQTLDTLVAWLIEESEKHPMLSVWEDLHWADPSTLEMLGLVLEQAPTVSMLNVLTFRPEFTPPWSTRSHMTPITLNRLERPQVEALITHLRGDKALPDEVVQHIVAKTDGVPLYVEELTKMLLTSDLLREETDQYVLTGPLSTVAIPDTLQDSLMARLDQMNMAKETAQLGAVIGREFAYEMLEAISSQDEETLHNGLAQLVGAELLYQRGRPPRARYVFKHALIQDAAYASLLKSTRQHVHQQIVQVLEDQSPETAESQPELLAHHYTEAGLAEQAVNFWHRAGEQAIQHAAYTEAINRFGKGLELLTTLPDTPEHLQQELTLQTTLALALRGSKGPAAPEVEQAYARARVLCQQVEHTPQLFPILQGLASFYLSQGQLQLGRELAEQCLSLAQRANDPLLLEQGYGQLGRALLWFGEFPQALTYLEQALAMHDPQQNRVSRVSGHPYVEYRTFAARTLWYLGYPEQALMKIHEALALAQSHPGNLMFWQFFMTLLHWLRRDSSATYEQADAAITYAMEHESRYWSAGGMCLRGWALTKHGHVDEGMTQLRQGIAQWRATGATVGVPEWLTMLAEGYAHIGQIDKGLSAVTEALTLVEQTGRRNHEAELHRLQGELLLQRSPDNQAETEVCFHKAIEVAQSQQAKSLELRAATSLAKLWQSQGKRDEARELLGGVYGWFTEGFDTADLIDAKALLDELSEGR